MLEWRVRSMHPVAGSEASGQLIPGHACRCEGPAQVVPPDRRHHGGYGDPRGRRGTAGGSGAWPGGDSARAAVFAVEYEGARRRLAAVRERALSAAHQVAASRAATACAVLFGVGAVGLGGLLIFTDLFPLSGAGTGVGAVIAGLTVLATIAYSLRELRRTQKADESTPAQQAKQTQEPGGRTGNHGAAGSS
jgi:hypothetical protein